MAYTATEIDEFERALAARKGARSISLGNGDTITFGSYEEGLQMLETMRQSIATNKVPRVRVAAYRKGV